MSAFVDHEGSLVGDDDFFALIRTDGSGGHNADVVTRLRLSLLENFTMGTDRVADEDGTRQDDVRPSQVRHDVHAQIGHRLADDQRERKATIDENSPEFGLLGIFSIEVNWVRVHRKHREERVVALRHGSCERVTVHVADFEILVIPTLPTGLFHTLTPQMYGGLQIVTIPHRTKLQTTRPGELCFFAIDHPLNPELIDEHAESCTPKRVLKRHINLTALGKAVKDALSLGEITGSK